MTDTTMDETLMKVMQAELADTRRRIVELDIQRDVIERMIAKATKPQPRNLDLPASPTPRGA